MTQLRDIAVIGGGPGGLYLSILLKRDRRAARVRVHERNRADETYGFGVAFHEATLRALAEADEPSRAALDEILSPWDDVMFSVRGTTRRVPGHGFSGCSRQRLLAMLHARAEALGVELVFEHDVTADALDDADLVVAADGANSRTRRLHEDHFRPSVDVRPNHFVWLGTTRPLDAMSFFFAESPDGVFVAHAYPHTPGEGTWIVEVDDETFVRSGLDGSSLDDTVAHLEHVFRDELGGHALIANDSSFWRQFPVVRCERWVKDDRLVLLGDAKGTVHYSIGSGTKLAMEDAVALHGALLAEPAPAGALHRYEAERGQALRSLQDIGRGSMRWFEQYPLHWPMPADQFIFAGVTRKTNETYATVAAKAPDLVAAATAALDPAAAELAGRSRSPSPSAGPCSRLGSWPTVVWTGGPSAWSSTRRRPTRSLPQATGCWS
jgi:anthraniloyl-CoA monooxygenase